MKNTKIFCGQRYYYFNFQKIGEKFSIIAEPENGGPTRAFLDSDGNAIFNTKEDAIKWWNSNSTKYNGTEVCAW